MEKSKTMDRKLHNNIRNQYKKREKTSSFSYITSNDRRNHTYRSEDDEKPLPYAIGFRLRMVLCIVLFLSFLFSDYYIFEEKETQIIYQKLEENTSKEDWKNYAVTAFKELRKIKN